MGLEQSVTFEHGVPEAYRADVARLYDLAFGEKFAVAIRSETDRRVLIARSLQLEFAIAAFAGTHLVGLAGFHTPKGSLTGGLDYSLLVSQLGKFRGSWAALLFGLYDRKTTAGELLMDGISVDPNMRGRGVGSGLLNELHLFARREGFQQIRLDVIDTNSNARRLYERSGFIETRTESFGFLRWLLGFGASTTMVKGVSGTA